MPVPDSPVIMTDASEPAICWASLMTFAIAVVTVDEIARIVRDRCKNRCDQFRIGGQGNVFFGPCVNRRDRSTGIGGDAAGDDRHMNVLCFQPHHEIADIQRNIDQQEIRAFAAADNAHCLLAVLGVGHRCTAFHGDFGRRGELPFQGTDNEKPHGILLLKARTIRGGRSLVQNN